MATFLLLDGSGYASTPDKASLDIIGDIDLRIDVDTDDSGSLVSKYVGAGNRSFFLTGILQLLTYNDSDSSTFAAPDDSIPSGRQVFRVTRNATTGDVTYYTSSSLSGPWSQLGTVQSTSSGEIATSTGDLEVGAQSGSANLEAKVYAVEVRDGIDGTVVANPVFEDQQGGTTSFDDSAGNTWTLQGTAEIVFQGGGSEAGVSVTSEGAGTAYRFGSSESHVAITSEASGSPHKSGAVETDVVISSEGSGFSERSGSSQTGVLVTAEGAGSPSYDGGSEASVVVIAEGSGLANRTGSSEASVVISAEGSGTGAKSGSSESIVVTVAEGSGSKFSEGSSETDVVVTAEGSGISEVSDGSTADVSITSEGSGSPLKSNGSESEVVVTSEAVGRKIASGGSESGVLVTAEGSGDAENEDLDRSGGSESLVSISSFGDGNNRNANKTSYQVFRNTDGVWVAIRQ